MVRLRIPPLKIHKYNKRKKYVSAMLGLLIIAWEKEVEVDNKIEKTYSKKAFLHR